MNKKIIICLAFLLSGLITSAQERGRERIKAFKTAYITQELDLSSEEAEKFWPVYNEYEKKLFDLKVREVKKSMQLIKESGGPDSMNDEESKNVLNKMLSVEKEASVTREKMYVKLSKVLTPQKLLKLYHAENNFNRKLLNEYRKGKSRK
ncbi:sensor of ECF-type sigma factor [Lutimonas saemankumensis]|uniref:Spy/CpxP family protein refolding chaperone n=1 Tax=Lutimonas saemankumensis TaxID=483016 RepID=UPI001CD4875B|nr:sensor of ECF-type sigma factor [Lutimonas saemankumensis]MCA0931989.1 sensor of ECF-type sigma factor [Lutimonas saemankumensis]